MTELSEWMDELYYQDKIESILKLAKNLGATQAEAALTSAQGLNVSVRLGEVENIEFNKDKALNITVYLNQSKGSASTADLSLEALEKTVAAAVNIAKVTESDAYAGLADKESMIQNIPDLDLYHPWPISVEEAKIIALECEKAALDFDTRINNSDGASLSTTESYYIYGNTHGLIAAYPSSMHSLSCMVIGEQLDKGKQRDYEYTVARNNRDLVSAKEVGYKAALKTIERLNPRKIVTQNVPVIFHAGIANSVLVPFLSAISGNVLYKKASFLLDKLNTPVFNKQITILEEPRLRGALGSAAFDAQGVTTENRILVSDGVLQTYLLDAYSARKLNMANTGHAGGARNILIKTTDVCLDLKTLLKQMGTGLLVTELIGQGINLVTGDYSKGAAGFWVENGEIQYPVHEITIAGNLKTMYQQIVNIAQDIDKRHTIQTGSILFENMMVAGLNA